MWSSPLCVCRRRVRGFRPQRVGEHVLRVDSWLVLIASLLLHPVIAHAGVGLCGFRCFLRREDAVLCWTGLSGQLNCGQPGFAAKTNEVQMRKNRPSQMKIRYSIFWSMRGWIHMKLTCNICMENWINSTEAATEMETIIKTSSTRSSGLFISTIKKNTVYIYKGIMFLMPQ